MPEQVKKRQISTGLLAHVRAGRREPHLNASSPGSKTGDFLSIFNVKPQGGINMLTYEEITKSEAIKTYIIRADESLGALGFTEHSFAHVMHVAGTAGYIFETIFNTIR